MIKFFRLDANDEWVNGAYDEFGNGVNCRECRGEMKWDPLRHDWYCRECGARMDRYEYFNYIVAVPPGPACQFECETNYPFCKKTCRKYRIPKDDPMLD